MSAAGRLAAVGFRAHTGWAAAVVVAGDVARLEVVLRRRVELADPSGSVPRNVVHRSRALDLAEASERIAAAERIGAEQASVELERIADETASAGFRLGSCAVVVGSLGPQTPLVSILASHALQHAAEGRLYQQALRAGAERNGLEAVEVPRATIWDEACWALDASVEELKERLAGVRREIGPPWAEDQRLAALAALVALADA